MKKYIKIAICFILAVLVMKLLSPFFILIGLALGTIVCTAIIWWVWSNLTNKYNLPI